MLRFCGYFLSESYGKKLSNTVFRTPYSLWRHLSFLVLSPSNHTKPLPCSQAHCVRSSLCLDLSSSTTHHSKPGSNFTFFLTCLFIHPSSPHPKNINKDDNNTNNKLLIHLVGICWVLTSHQIYVLLPLCALQALYPNPSKALVIWHRNWLLRRPAAPWAIASSRAAAVFFISVSGWEDKYKVNVSWIQSPYEQQLTAYWDQFPDWDPQLGLMLLPPAGLALSQL